MRLKTKIKNAVRRNERRMTTKKAKRAQKYIALAIAFMLAITALISWANSSTTITIDNSKNWDARIAVESAKPKAEHMDEAKDGVVVATKEEGDVQSIPSSDVVKMIEEKFSGQERIAVAIAKSESGLDPKKPSDTDRLADGRPFSIGLMQINLTVHKLNGVDCNKAFSGKDYKAKVVNEELYQECVKLAEDAEINLATAHGIWERSGNNFGKWGGYTNGSFKKFL